MAIVFDCPHCGHNYRLKDELAGRKATCKNPDCRQQITIPAPPSGAELEAAALSALADEAKKEEQAAAAEKVIPVTCNFCGHNWTEPMAKAGKNTLCPECRQRIKVPEPKEETSQDWRQQKTKLPSLAKQAHEKLEGVQDAGQAQIVSGEALREADATGIEYEPRSFKQKATIALGALTLVGVVVFGVWYLFSSRKDDRDHQLMVEAFNGQKEFAKELAPAEAGLCSATIFMAGAEYDLRQNNDKKLEDASKHLGDGVRELQKAPPSHGRNLLLAEAASTTIAFGGNEEEVKAGIRLRWQPSAIGGNLAAGQKHRTVHEELRKSLQHLAHADPDFKFAVARRLTREIVKKGQAEFAADLLPQVLFNDAQRDEALAVVALEIRRQDPGSDVPARVAAQLKGKIEREAKAKADPKAKDKGPAWNPYPASAQPLCAAVGIDFKPLSLPPGTGGVSEAVRTAFVGRFLLVDKNENAALEVATRGAPADSANKLKALALCAEWMDDPARALDSALAVVSSAKGKSAIPQYALLRLSQVGFEKGKYHQAKELADALADEGMRAWAHGDGVRQRAAGGFKDKAEEGWVEVPTTPDKLRAGHAWGRLWVARQNARVSGDREAEKRVVAGWSPAPLRPFGLVGIALGLRDRE
jgi:hypothetical protein